MNDDRNQLFREYVRLLRGLQPKVFVMENVSGMVKGKMKLIFVEILKELKASGYEVSARLLNAMYFNVPQSRERMIFIGVRKDLEKMPSHPNANNIPISCENALRHIQVINKEELASRCHRGQLWAIRKAKAGEQLSKYHPKGHWFNYFRIHKNRPSQALPKTGHDKTYHYSEDRVLSIQELQTLSSFPIDYKFTGKYEDAWHRVGNCVPPLFMYAIAKYIKENIL